MTDAAADPKSQALSGQHVLLCVCGGIAAYKAAELVRRLRDAGAQVRVAMTETRSASSAPLTLPGAVRRAGAHLAVGRARPKRRWATSNWRAGPTASWSRRPPPNTLAKLAHGFADDLVSTLCLATDRADHGGAGDEPPHVAASGDAGQHGTLRARGVQVIGPEDGPLAEGESGPGRLSEPDAIVARAGAGDVTERGFACGRCAIVVSAGPTFEDIDPVRFIGNRSSGKMGFAIAAAAARARRRRGAGRRPGARWPRPTACERIDVRSAAQMHDAVLAALPVDVYIGAAAVADFTPRQFASSKIKKQRRAETD